MDITYYPDTIPIVFASDDYFVPYMSAMMQSIMENADKNRKYNFFVLHQNISTFNIELLKQQCLFFSNFNIDFINVAHYFVKSKFFIENRSDITIETYFRLVIPYIFTEYEKVIYLDGDMICCTDIAQLYEIDLGNNLLASTRDILGVGTYYRYGKNGKYEQKEICDGIVALKNKDNYFLNGLLIFNIKKWTIPIDELFNFAASRKWLVHDQDILNVLCEGKALLLPLIYQFTDFSQDDDFHYCLNYLPENIKREYFDAQKNIKIIHFNTSIKKPWNMSVYVPYFALFWKYATRTPFIDVIIARMQEKKLLGKCALSLQERVLSDIRNKESIGWRFILKCIKAKVLRR
jgi:lipopolysaccharide biosynthesis glycosyltransferase